MGGSSFNVRFDPLAINALIAEIGALPANVEKAANIAAREAMKKAATSVSREVAAALNLPVRALRTRINLIPGGEGRSWVLFLGLNPVPMDKTGPVSQNAYGLVHRSNHVKGGFVREMGRGGKGWIRVGRARSLGLDLPGLGSGSAHTKRLPLLRLSHDLEPAATPSFERHTTSIERDFMRRFEHHLKRFTKR